MKNFQSAWRSNHGSLLLVIAVVATVAVSGIWYFDLLPNIELVAADSQKTVASSVLNPPTVIVVTIVPPRTTSKKPITGYVRVHPAFGSLPDDTYAIAARQFQLIDNRAAPVVFTELNAGEYALCAFLDLNGNGLLDISEKGYPTEPFRLSNFKDASSRSLDLEDASVSLGRGQTLKVQLDLRRQTAAALEPK